jgi:hypothetical protein
VHGTGVYSTGVGPKGLALERFIDIKKKKKKEKKERRCMAWIKSL